MTGWELASQLGVDRRSPHTSCMRPTPLLVVFGLLVLAALGWFWFGQDLGIAPQPTPPKAAVDAGEVPGDAVAGAVVAGADAASSTAELASDDPQRVAATAGAAAGVMLRGRLVDARSQPRAGVDVQLDTWRRDNGFEFLPPSVLPPGSRERPKASATTAADGTFALAIDKNHRGRLSLPDGELVFAAGDPRVDPAETYDLGDLQVLRAATIAGVVKDEFGKPLADVKVSARSGSLGFGMTSSSTTDRDGKFRLAKLTAGTWHLRTATAQYLPAAEKVALGAEEQKQDVVLALLRGAAISGQVIDDRGVPVSGCKVAAQRQEERGGVRIERFAADEAAVTDEAGYFTLAGLTGETTTVRVFGGTHTEAVAAGVRVGTADLLLTVHRLGVIEGVLVGSDGKPIADSRVFAQRDDGAAAMPLDDLAGLPLLEMPSRVRSAADGTFRIEGVRPGPTVVLANGDTHRPVRLAGLTIAPAQVLTGVRLVAEAGASALVTVVDTGGAPVAKARVSVRRAPEGGREVREVGFSRAMRAEFDNGEVRIGGGRGELGSAVTDAEGKAVVSALPDGQLEFTASHEEHAASRAVVVLMPSQGQVQTSLTVRTPGFVDVTVIGADGAALAGAPFSVEGPLGVGETATKAKHNTNAEGKLHVGPLAPGDYNAVLVRDNQGHNVGGAFVMVGNDADAIEASQRSFRIAAGETTVIDLRKPMAVRLHGKVIGATGPVAGCHVELEAAGGDLPQMPGMGGRTAVCDANGEYEFTDVEAGSYVLRYGREESLVKARFERQVNGDLADVVQDLFLRTGTLRVQAVVAGTGEPIAAAQVELQVAEPEAAAGAARPRRMMMVTMSMTGDASPEATTITMGQQRTKTGADGWVQIEDVPVGTYDVKVSHDKYTDGKRSERVVSERQVTDAGSVELRPAGRMRGKVVAADGRNVPIALVEYRAENGEGRESQPAMGGKFSFASLAPGRYLVRAQSLPLGPGEPGPWGEDSVVEVSAGETATAELRLPAR